MWLFDIFRAKRGKQRRPVSRQWKPDGSNGLEPRELLATIAQTLPEFNGQEFRGSGTQYPRPPVQVGTFNFGQDLQGLGVESATISGTFGNSTVPHSAAVDLLLDGIRIGGTGEFDQGPPVTWARTLTGTELAVLQDGVAELTAVQTSNIAIRLGETRLQVTTSATPSNPPFVSKIGPPPTAIPTPSSPLTPGVSAPAAVRLNGEPGDIRAEAIDLGAITRSVFVEDEISDVNDIDFYKFTAVRGQIITFDIDAPGLDSNLKITAPGSKRTIAASNNGRSEELEEAIGPLGDDSFIRFVAPDDGTYFLAVSNFRYVIPFDPDTTEGRDFRGDPRLPETGAYRLTIRTPNIRSGAIRVEPSQRGSRNLTLTLTFEVRETNLDPRYPLTYSINNAGNATPILRGPINQRDTNGIPTNLIGSHTVAFDVPASVLAGNTAKFINLDPPSERSFRGVFIESDEFDNTSLVNFNSDDCNPRFIQRPTARLVRPRFVDIEGPILNPGGKIGVGVVGLKFEVGGRVVASVQCSCGNSSQNLIRVSRRITTQVTVGVGVTLPLINILINKPLGATNAAIGAVRAARRYSVFSEALEAAGESQIIPALICRGARAL